MRANKPGLPRPLIAPYSLTYFGPILGLIQSVPLGAQRIMHVGINEVVLRGQSDGTRQRELNALEALDGELYRRGHQLSVYLAANATPELTQAIRDRVCRGRVVMTPVPSHPIIIRSCTGQRYFTTAAETKALDCLHTAYYPIPRTKCPRVLTVNDLRFLAYPETYSFPRLAFLRWAVPRAIRQADLVIAISEYTKNEICYAYGTPPEKIVVAHIPIPQRIAPQNNSETGLGSRDSPPLPRNFLLSIGHLEPRKNYLRILKAFSRFQTGRSDGIKLVIVGAKSLQWNKVLEAADAEGCRENVFFTGYVGDDELFAILRRARALVFPSLHEGFGVPVLEAMAAGVPVLTSNTTALPEVAGDAACLVDPTCVEEIADAMRRIVDDGCYAEELRVRGVSRISQFTPQKTASVLVAAYERLA